MNTIRQTRSACRKRRRHRCDADQIGQETGGRKGGGRERWLKPGKIAICRVASGVNDADSGEALMAGAACAQAHALPQQAPPQPRGQPWPPSCAPDLSAMCCDGCASNCRCWQPCVEAAVDTVFRASAPRNGVTASAMASRYSDSRWQVSAMGGRVALIPQHNQGQGGLPSVGKDEALIFTRVSRGGTRAPV